jgi:UDP-N-acetylglucosamine 1-carboxyvinyltransferase
MLPGVAAEMALLGAMGVKPEWLGEELQVKASHPLRGIDITVQSHGIFSDSQPFFALLSTSACSPSTIRDTVWKDRFGYAEGLRRLGARVVVEDDLLRIHPGRLHIAGETVVGADLRATAVLVAGALSIDGPTRIRGIEHLRRGYADFLGKLTRLGAHIVVAA